MTMRPPGAVPVRHAIPDEYYEWREKWLSRLPDHDTITRGLSDAFVAAGRRSPPVVVDREINMSWSTSATEIVTCRFADNTELRVLVKYAAVHKDDLHRRGADYEARVYSSILKHSPLPTPEWFGTFVDPVSGGLALVMGYVPDGIRLHKTERPGAPQSAARAIGRFHADLAKKISQPEFSFLHRYDTAYYLASSQRMHDCTQSLKGEFPWLDDVHRRADTWINRLVNGPVTVIHGEFFPDNVIMSGDVPRGVDWETAAIARGEIDLACLTSGHWPTALVQDCEAEYAAARWAGEPPPDHESALAAARIYLHCRSLGESCESATGHWQRWRFPQLQGEAALLGLL
jgi:hypothetical protein